MLLATTAIAAIILVGLGVFWVIKRRAIRRNIDLFLIKFNNAKDGNENVINHLVDEHEKQQRGKRSIWFPSPNGSKLEAVLYMNWSHWISRELIRRRKQEIEQIAGPRLEVIQSDQPSSARWAALMQLVELLRTLKNPEINWPFENSKYSGVAHFNEAADRLVTQYLIDLRKQLDAEPENGAIFLELFKVWKLVEINQPPRAQKDGDLLYPLGLKHVNKPLGWQRWNKLLAKFGGDQCSAHDFQWVVPLDSMTQDSVAGFAHIALRGNDFTRIVMAIMLLRLTGLSHDRLQPLEAKAALLEPSSKA